MSMFQLATPGSRSYRAIARARAQERTENAYVLNKVNKSAEFLCSGDKIDSSTTSQMADLGYYQSAESAPEYTER